MNKEYFIGIDIGTNTIGYAATDTHYNLIKKSSKSIWGIRLFDELSTAAERRVFRSNRRRLQRRKERISLLQTLFEKEIANVDEVFFIRLKESKYHLEDKPSKMNDTNTLFNDKDFNDKDYYKSYPTIHHLKKHLIESDKKFDIRLIYLAIHHIIKNRGHFLFDNIGERKPNFRDIFQKFNILINDMFEIYFEETKISEFEEILKDNEITSENKEKKIGVLFNINKKDIKKKLIIKALCNIKFDFYKLFEDESLKDDNGKNISKKISELTDEFLHTLNLYDDYKEILVILKAIYDWSVLENILKDNDYICLSKVEIYEKHKEDLKILKSFIKLNFSAEDYDCIFKNEDKNIKNYCSYIRLNKQNDEKSNIKKCKKEEFYEELKKVLNKFKNKEDCDFIYINNEIKKGDFLPKQVNKDNSLIPYQVNLFELKAILQNASKHYPFFNQKDESGITVSEKILSIFNFKIPYYVGPLNSHSPYSWFVKNSDMQNEKILPWNFERVINIEETSEKFIRNMTNKCTYLPKEDVLAKNSLIYSKFMVLNEINNLKINDVKISFEIKNLIFEDLFLNKKRVTLKNLKDYLILNGYMQKNDVISGIDIEIKSSLASYIDFKDIIEKYKDLHMVDDIINYIVIFRDDKKILKSKITKKYGNILTNDEINKCCLLKYTGWGRLSKKLLTEITDVNKETGEILNILNMMKSTNYNLMELLSKNFNFEQKIRDENSLIEKDESLLNIIDNLYVSPKVKKPIYQSLLIIKEIVKTQKYSPKKIFIEVAREKLDDKQRTKTRKKKLLDLYKSLGNEYKDLYNEIQNTQDKEFDKIKLYLYYQQLGKCMYSGQRIPLEDLMNVNIYDRDHIFPQSKIKDDSFNNLVLVRKEINAKKSNEYPLKEDIQAKMKDYWVLLKEKGLISEEKYKRLTRKTSLTEDELNVFIQRQLVETRQATKVIASLLKEIYPETEIVYVKANWVSDFRKNFDLVKSRDLNDYHHAKDAYLNIVVGNVYNTEFNHKFYIERLKNNTASLKEMFKYNVQGAWDKEKSINIVKNTMLKNNILFTRYSHTKVGKLFNETIYPASKNSNLFPIKKDLDVTKYGGYKSKSVAYFALVEHTKGKKVDKSIEFIYMYNKDLYERQPQKYCEHILGLKNPKILINKIKINTLFSLDGLYVHLSGKSEQSLLFKPAMQLILNYEDEKYIKKLSKYAQKTEEEFLNNEKYIINQIEISREKNIMLYNKLANKILNSKYNILFNNIYNFLQDGKDAFENKINLYEQCKIILEILKILHCNSSKGNLGLLFNGKNSTLGNISISKNALITKYSSLKIIYQSITGLYEQEIDLLGTDFKPKRKAN